MSLSLFPLRRKLHSFWRERSGATLLTFALAIIPLTLAVAVTIEYSNAVRARNLLSAAADNAALSGVAAASNYVAANGSSPASLAAAVTVAQNAAQSVFAANTAGFNAATLTFTGSTPTVTAAGATVSVTANASLPQVITLPGRSALNIGASSSASSSGSAPQYIDIYVLVDNSQSMAIGASASDQAAMESDPKIGCMLACHRTCQLGQSGCDSTSSPYGNVYNGTATGYFDSVSYARSKYQLRFDVVKSALNTIATQAQAFQTSNPGSVVRFGIYTFANELNTVLPITSVYGSTSSPNSIFWGINQMEIADTLAGTELNNALQNFSNNGTISPAPGTGASAASPKVFVLLMTDGVSNANYTTQPTASDLAAGNAYYWNYSSTILPAFTGTNCWGSSNLPTGSNLPWPNGGAAASALPVTWGGSTPLSNPTACVPDPLTATHVGNGQMQLSVLDPSYCTAIKNGNATLMTLETAYVTDTADPYDWRTVYISNFLLGGWSSTNGVNYIRQGLQACASVPQGASSPLAYTANSATDIQSAIQSMFAATTSGGAAGPHLIQ